MGTNIPIAKKVDKTLVVVCTQLLTLQQMQPVIDITNNLYQVSMCSC